MKIFNPPPLCYGCIRVITVFEHQWFGEIFLKPVNLRILCNVEGWYQDFPQNNSGSKKIKYNTIWYTYIPFKTLLVKVYPNHPDFIYLTDKSHPAGCLLYFRGNWLGYKVLASISSPLSNDSFECYEVLASISGQLSNDSFECHWRSLRQIVSAVVWKYTPVQWNLFFFFFCKNYQ